MPSQTLTEIIVDLDQITRDIEIAAARAQKYAADNGIHKVQQEFADHARIACYEIECLGRQLEWLESDDTRSRVVAS